MPVDWVSERPVYYAMLAEAVYKHEPQKYFDHSLPEVEMLAVDHIHNWKVILIHNKNTDEWAVVFRGVDNWSNIFSAIRQHFKEDGHLLNRIGKLIEKWQNRIVTPKGGKISVFVGHSHGGYFADHVRKAWEVFRVTFDPHKPERGPRNLNFRTNNDPCSKFPVSVEDRSSTFDFGGGHSIHELVGKLQDTNPSWNDLEIKKYVGVTADSQKVQETSIPSPVTEPAETNLFLDVPQTALKWAAITVVASVSFDVIKCVWKKEQFHWKETFIKAAKRGAVMGGISAVIQVAGNYLRRPLSTPHAELSFSVKVLTTTTSTS